MTAKLRTLSVLSLLVAVGLAEVFTSYYDLTRMVDAEGRFTASLEAHIQSEEQRLNQLREVFGLVKSQMAAAAADRVRHLDNPINLYFLISRIAAGWDVLKELLSSCSSGQDVVTDIEGSIPLPGDDDAEGAAMALLRLQDTYKLDAEQMSSGLLSEVYRSPEFTAGQCFDLGSVAYRKDDHYHTVMWMQEALRRLEKEEETQRTAARFDVLDYLAFSAYKQGSVRHALTLTKEMLAMDDHESEHGRLLANKATYEQLLVGPAADGHDPGVDALGHIKNERPKATFPPTRDAYEGLCRGDGVMNDPARMSKLTCYYLTRNNPRLLLSPAKVEEAFDRPSIWLFHDLLLDSEMELIKTLAKPKLQRASVFLRNVTGMSHSAIRISKSAWLAERLHAVVAKVNQRFEDLVGLDVTTAEHLQVANYGVGGHYEPHHDFLPADMINEVNSRELGNRMATMLIYVKDSPCFHMKMNDVAAGGATVFPKGTGVFWYNLFRAGNGVDETLHAACPVLFGHKWVANKWFHERGQEFRRPCSLDPSE